jgi:nicotinamidase-related amidase
LLVEGTEPYPWPYDGRLDPRRLALLVLGAQWAWRDRSQRADEVTATVEGLAAGLRAAGALVVLVRHHRSPLRAGAGVRPDLPPARGSPAAALALDVAMADCVVDAGGNNAFFASELDGVLRAAGRDQLCLAGFGAEATVDSTIRSANDRGYECLLLTDAVAPFDDATGARAISSVTMSGGIFGAIGTSRAVADALDLVLTST